MNMVKTEMDAIECVAHELAHLELGTAEHGPDFEDAWRRILDRITTDMED